MEKGATITWDKKRMERWLSTISSLRFFDTKIQQRLAFVTKRTFPPMRQNKADSHQPLNSGWIPIRCGWAKTRSAQLGRCAWTRPSTRWYINPKESTRQVWLCVWNAAWGVSDPSSSSQATETGNAKRIGQELTTRNALPFSMSSPALGFETGAVLEKEPNVFVRLKTSTLFIPQGMNKVMWGYLFRTSVFFSVISQVNREQSVTGDSFQLVFQKFPFWENQYLPRTCNRIHNEFDQTYETAIQNQNLFCLWPQWWRSHTNYISFLHKKIKFWLLTSVSEVLPTFVFSFLISNKISVTFLHFLFCSTNLQIERQDGATITKQILFCFAYHRGNRRHSFLFWRVPKRNSVFPLLNQVMLSTHLIKMAILALAGSTLFGKRKRHEKQQSYFTLSLEFPSHCSCVCFWWRHPYRFCRFLPGIPRRAKKGNGRGKFYRSSVLLCFLPGRKCFRKETTTLENNKSLFLSRQNVPDNTCRLNLLKWFVCN